MPYYRTCPYCGAHLDYGERCDCQKEPEANSQALGNLQKKAPASVGSTDGSGAEKIKTPVSASHDTREMEEMSNGY